MDVKVIEAVPHEKIKKVAKSIKKRLPKPKIPNSLSLKEWEIQKMVAAYLDFRGILFYHCPNEGKCSFKTAQMLKSMGVKRGVPDLCIPVPNKSHHGLYMELKRNSKCPLTPEQFVWLKRLNENGYHSVVCHSYDDAIAVIEDYLYN